MVVSVTASTTQGKNLTKEELDIVTSSCEMAIDLAEKKARIFEYVESRMAFIAPNLSAIVGSNVAAKLMGAAGGLTKLSKMPSNNISLLGRSRMFCKSVVLWTIADFLRVLTYVNGIFSKHALYVIS